LIESPLMHAILPQAAFEHEKAMNYYLSVVSSTSLKLILSVLPIKNKRFVFNNTSSIYIKQQLKKTLRLLRNSKKLREFVFSQKDFKHITAQSRYYELIPSIIERIEFLALSGIHEIKILDVGCAPQNQDVGAPALESLLSTLKKKFPNIEFIVTATDVHLDETFLVGNNSINYIQDNIAETSLDDDFDIVIFMRVPIFNGINKNHQAREQSISNLFKLSEKGILFYDTFLNDQILVYENGNLSKAIVSIDYELVSRVFLKMGIAAPLTLMLELKEMFNTIGSDSFMGMTENDFTEGNGAVNSILLNIFADAKSSQLAFSWLSDMQNGFIRPFPELVFMPEMKTKSKAHDLLEKALARRAHISKELSTKEFLGEYPWMEGMNLSSAMIEIGILNKIVESNNKEYGSVIFSSQFQF